MLIHEGLSPHTILLKESPADADAALARMAGPLARELGVKVQLVRDEVIARERVRSTAVAAGAAIPHCRLTGISRFGVALLTADPPIRWDALGHSVDLVLMITGPRDAVSDHLRILANASRLLSSPAFRDRLRSAEKPEQVIRLVRVAEEVIEQQRHRDGMLGEIGGAAGDPGELEAAIAHLKWP